MNDLSWQALKLEPLPFESSVSALWLYCWRNVTNAEQLLKLISAKKSYPKHVFNADLGWLDLAGINAITRWTLFTNLEREFFQPGGDGLRYWTSEILRFCPLCLEDTYHSYWHQSVFLDVCPFHNVRLCESCQLCEKATDDFGSSSRTFNDLYWCRHCGGPIAGARPSLSGRRELDRHRVQIEKCFEGVHRWWTASAGARERILRLTCQRTGVPKTPANVELAQSALNALCGSPPGGRSFSRPLEWVIWKGAAVTPMRTARIERLYPCDYRKYMQKSYRWTVRALERTVGSRYPFSFEEYRRHLAWPIHHKGSSTVGYEPHLLALAIMRRYLEVDWGWLSVRSHESPLLGLAAFSQFGRQSRRHWRAILLCIYAGVYACVRKAPGGVLDWDALQYIGPQDIFVYVKTGFWDGLRYHETRLEYGEAFWPAVDGLILANLGGAGLQGLPD